MSLSAIARFTPRGDLGQFVQVRVTPAVRASVEAGVQLIQEAAQSYCPVDTGALRDSITYEVEDTGRSVVGRVGPHTDYAEFVEYGTGRRGAGSPGAGAGPYDENWPGMPAQPYMRPALDGSREPIAELFASNLSLAVKSG